MHNKTDLKKKKFRKKSFKWYSAQKYNFKLQANVIIFVRKWNAPDLLTHLDCALSIYGPHGVSYTCISAKVHFDQMWSNRL